MNDAIVHFHTLSSPFNDPLVLEQRKVLGYRGLRQSETLPDMLDIAFLGTKARHNLQADRMTHYLQYLSFRIELLAYDFHVTAFK